MPPTADGCGIHGGTKSSCYPTTDQATVGGIKLGIYAYRHRFRHHHMFTERAECHKAIKRLSSQGQRPASSGSHVDGFAQMRLGAFTASTDTTRRRPRQDYVISLL